MFISYRFSQCLMTWLTEHFYESVQYTRLWRNSFNFLLRSSMLSHKLSCIPYISPLTSMISRAVHLVLWSFMHTPFQCTTIHWQETTLSNHPILYGDQAPATVIGKGFESQVRGLPWWQLEISRHPALWKLMCLHTTRNSRTMVAVPRCPVQWALVGMKHVSFIVIMC